MALIALPVTAAAVVDAINKRSWPEITARCDFNVRFEDMSTGQSAKNVQQFVDYLRSWTKTFPDLTLNIEFSSSAGNTEVSELKLKGTQHSAFLVADGIIPATNQVAEWRACLIIERSKNKVIKVRLYYDLVTILDQLATPPSVSPTAGTDEVVVP